MITLHGSNENYFFNVNNPFVRPGKFSVVFKGVNSNGENVIVKKIRQPFSFSKIENAINHSAFVKTIEVVNHNDDFYLIRPYVQGNSLVDLKNTNWFSSERKLEILKLIISKIGEALSSLHDQNMVHLDIRPHNIIACHINDISKLDVRIIDLETVRLINSEDQVNTFPLLYAAPELLLNFPKLIDQRTDIYSLAITFYELLFNKIPFQNNNPEFITHLMLNSKLDYIQHQNKNIIDILNKASNKSSFSRPPLQISSEEIEEILITGMDSRYQSIDEFINALLSQLKVNKNWMSRLFEFFNS